MLQKVITQKQITWWKDNAGHVVQVTTRYIESTLASGKVLEHVDRYDALDEDEARDVIEAVSVSDGPGQELMIQMSMFTLA